MSQPLVGIALGQWTLESAKSKIWVTRFGVEIADADIRI